ncbi:hypothetical protein A3K86_01770 [Photobacterium jeanii]|uniref:Uncharacterized protein n=1 Tax=Photobacterium jeanii TaxID=858640 RepID=A0A178KL18_9GAMM|nr:hypothetical protein A3K86_01770 [Photobacterium jeanii]PST92668.1 hypothetical protein C9I91_05715 [Photobacterium jeanii]
MLVLKLFIKTIKTILGKNPRNRFRSHFPFYKVTKTFADNESEYLILDKKRSLKMDFPPNKTVSYKKTKKILNY